MLLSNNSQVNESFYTKEAQKLLQKIGEATGEAADLVRKFDVQTNSDKICISTVGNNFAQDLEYSLNNLQHITIENYKKGDDTKNLKEAIQAFSTFVHSIQLAFGNDLNKLKSEIVNVLQNLVDQLKPLLDIVQGNSPYSSKREISSLLDYLYIAIEKVKLRIGWEHLDQAGLNKAYTDIYEQKIVSIENLKDKEDFTGHFCRVSHGAVEGVLHVLEQMNVDMDHCDDRVRDLTINLSARIADSIFNADKLIRDKKTMSELILISKMCTITVVPAVKEMLQILNNEILQDANGNVKNFVLNTMVNALCCSIRFTGDLQRILEN